MSDEAANDAVIEIDGVSKRFGNASILRQVDLKVSAGAIIALLGPSGCGKTTLLRLISGLERPDKGRIALHGRVVAQNGVFIPPEKRGVGLVFQDYALFPQYRVAENVAFGLRTMPRHEREEVVTASLARVDMTGYEERYPHELSGGQQQRVALARALAPNPGVLLLDEPFSNLDAALRRRLRIELGALLRSLSVTTVFVTHDQEEALGVADEVAVMATGRVEQVGTPREVYQSPATKHVASAVGEVNWVSGVGERGRFESVLGEVFGDGPDGPGELLVRPEHLVMKSDAGADGLAAVVKAVEFLGSETHALVDADGVLMSVRGRSQSHWQRGDRIRLCWRQGMDRHRWFGAQ